jgi:hypothetical protein
LPARLAGKTGTPLRGILTSFMFAPRRGKAKNRWHGRRVLLLPGLELASWIDVLD